MTASLRLPLALATALLLSGCGDRGDTTTGPLDDGGVPTELTDPVEVIRSLALAWGRRDLAALDALLAPDFEYCVRDPSLFPWLPGDCWSRDTELAFAANMFDPAYAGTEPPVRSIEIELTVLDVTRPVAGIHEIPTDAVVTVLTGPADGWSFDTRLVITLVEQPDGFLRVRRIRELLKLEPRAGVVPGLKKATWGELKALYN